MTTSPPPYVIQFNVAAYLINDEPVNGFAWYELTLPKDLVLFIPNADTDECCVEYKEGQLVRVEGGRLTPEGEKAYRMIAQAQFLVARPQPHQGQQSTRAFHIWSDNPNRLIRLQVTERWGLVDRDERESMISAHILALTNATGRRLYVGHAPDRHE